MKATNNNIGETFKVRLLNYKSFRHYGGRDIQTLANIVEAVLVGLQDGHQRYIADWRAKAMAQVSAYRYWCIFSVLWS